MLCYNKFQNVVFSGKQSLSFLFFFWILKWLDKFSFVYFLWLTFLWVRTFFVVFFSWKLFDLSFKNSSFFFRHNTESLIYFSKDSRITSVYFFQIINKLLFENFYKNLNNGFWSVYYKFSRIRPIISKRRRSFNFFKPFLKLKRLTFFFKRTKHNIFRKILKSYFLFICLVFFLGIRYKKFRRFFKATRSFKLRNFLKVIINYCTKNRAYLVLFLSFFRLFGKTFFKVSHYVYRYLKYFSFSFLKYFFNKNTNLLNVTDFMHLMTWKNKYTMHNLINKIPFGKKNKYPMHEILKIFKLKLKLKKKKKKRKKPVILKKKPNILKPLNNILKNAFSLSLRYGIKSKKKYFKKVRVPFSIIVSLNKKLMKEPLLKSYDFVGYILDYFGINSNINKKCPRNIYKKLTKNLKRYYYLYRKEWKRINHKKKNTQRLFSIFGKNIDIRRIRKIRNFTWNSLKFHDYNHNLMFLDRFLILRAWKKFYMKFRYDFYKNYLNFHGVFFKMLQNRALVKDPQDKEFNFEKNRNKVIIENKDKNLVVYIKKGKIIIENKDKNNKAFVIDNKYNINYKNKIIFDTTTKNKLIINNKYKDKKFYYSKNKINIETLNKNKNKNKNKNNSLKEPVALILEKPDFGFFLNSLNNNNFLTFNFAFLSKFFKKLIFLNNWKTKSLSGLTSMDSGINGFFIPFVLKKFSKDIHYGLFIPFFNKINLKENFKYGLKNFKKIKDLVIFHLKNYVYITLNELNSLKRCSIDSFFENLYNILYKYGFPFGRFVSENAKNVIDKRYVDHLFFYKLLWILICKFLYKDNLFLLSLRPMIFTKFINLIKKTNKFYNTTIKKTCYLPFFNKNIKINLDNKYYNIYFNNQKLLLNNQKFLQYKKSNRFNKLASKKKYYDFFFKVFHVKYVPFDKSKNYKRLQKLLLNKKHYHKFITKKYTSKYCKFSYFFKYVFKSKNKRFKKRLTKRMYCLKRLKRLKKGIKKFNKKKAKKRYKKFRKPLLKLWLRQLRKNVIQALRKQLIYFFLCINTLIIKDLFFNKKVKYLHHFFFLHNVIKKKNERFKKLPKSIYKPVKLISYKFNNFMKYGNSSLKKKFNLRFLTVNQKSLNYYKIYNINSLNFFY